LNHLKFRLAVFAYIIAHLTAAHALANAPSPPGSLEYVICSDTAAKISWALAPENERIRDYDIYRNNELIAQVFDTNSYLDLSLNPDNDYTYAVLAVDAEGYRSVAATTTLSTTLSISVSEIDHDIQIARSATVFYRFMDELFHQPGLDIWSVLMDFYSHDSIGMTDSNNLGLSVCKSNNNERLPAFD